MEYFPSPSKSKQSIRCPTNNNSGPGDHMWWFIYQIRWNTDRYILPNMHPPEQRFQSVELWFIHTDSNRLEYMGPTTRKSELKELSQSLIYTSPCTVFSAKYLRVICSGKYLPLPLPQKMGFNKIKIRTHIRCSSPRLHKSVWCALGVSNRLYLPERREKKKESWRRVLD